MESESRKVGNLAVPEALIAAMRASPCLRLDLPDEERVRLLLEDYDSSARPKERPPSGDTVRFRRYEPNRVEVEVSGGGGFLVLTDVWYPGWTATVDGVPVPVYRANYVFRAVEVPSGRHEVVFRFEPASYRRGRLLSLGTLAAVGLFGVVLLVRRVRQGRQARSASAGLARFSPR